MGILVARDRRPENGAIVMSTAVISVACQMTGVGVLGRALAGLAFVVWALLGALLARGVAVDRGLQRALRTPSVLTAVAATAGLGSALAANGSSEPAPLLLALSAAVWLVLLPAVLWFRRTPTRGASFLTCVATQSLAVLGATVFFRTTHVRWMLAGDCALIAAGLGLYVWTLASFDWRQLRTGAGDHWILAGALSISALATAEALRADPAGVGLAAIGPVLRAMDVGLWSLAVAGVCVLAVFELRFPRWSYDVRRWATVFPLGMTAAATQATGRAEGVLWMTRLGEVLTWIALATCAVVAAGALRHWAGRVTHVDRDHSRGGWA
jgi:hypothetical protein